MQLNITGFTPSEVMSLLLEGLTARKADLEAAITNIQGQMGAPKPAQGRPAKAAPAKPKTTRGPMSEEAKAKIVAAQKKRWAKYHKEQKAASKAEEKATGTGAPKRTKRSKTSVPEAEQVVEQAEAAV